MWVDASVALVSFWETTGISRLCVLCDIATCLRMLNEVTKQRQLNSPFNSLSSKVTNRTLFSSLMSQSWHNFKCQFWTLYVAVYLLISIINCHKYHLNVSFLSCISCRGGPNFSMASTSHCNYRLIPTDGYSAHCGHSSFDNVDEVSHLVTCKVFKNNCGASIHICTVGVYYIECML